MKGSATRLCCGSGPMPLSKTLDSDIGAYALAASAAGVALLACAIPADAAPICKTPAFELYQTATYALNPANQKTPAFNVAQSFHTFSTVTNTGINRGFFIPNVAGAQVALSSKGFVANVASGVSIGPGGKFGKGQLYGLLFTYTPEYGATYNKHAGNLQFGQDNYLGFRFLISGKAHYGWIRLKSTIRPFRTPYVITEIAAYGYESQANTAIAAGSCGAQANGAGSQSEHPDLKPTDQTANGTPSTSLGELALGAAGLPLWRRK